MTARNGSVFEVLGSVNAGWHRLLGPRSLVKRGTVDRMLQKAGLLALAAFGLVAGCNDSFECAADSHCELDGVAGFCESLGHCSFPDQECDSGRRFGGLAGTLSNQCVPADEGEPSTSDVSTGSGTEPNASTLSPTTTTTTLSSTGTGAGGSSSTDSGPESSSGEGPTLPCTTLYEDSFPGDTLDPTWLVQGDPMVLAGAVRFAINPEEIGVYKRVVALGGTRLDLSEGVITLELESIPELLRTQGTLTLSDPDASILLLWESGGVRPITDDGSVDHSAMTLPWVRVAFTAGAEGKSTVVFSESEDGTDWVEFATVDDLAFDASETSVALTAGSYEKFAIPQEFAVRSISICGDSGGL